MKLTFEDDLNTLAEIQRCCKCLIGNVTKVKLIDNLPVEEFLKIARKVDHPTPDFNIYTDGLYYLIVDGRWQRLYERRIR